jgi:mannose-6-phosphate isomerase-like protein (cupin superfamily)
METDRAITASTQVAPFGLPQSASAGSGCHERHSVLSAYRLPVERPGRHRHLFVQFGIPAISRMDRSWSARCLLATRNGQVRRTQGHQLVLAVDGWRDDEGPGGRFKKTGPNPTDRSKRGVKRIQVKPGTSLSLQKHHHRAGNWIVVKGTAEVTSGDSTRLLPENRPPISRSAKPTVWPIPARTRSK